jgi:8-oxo-dGTP diphosphatase
MSKKITVGNVCFLIDKKNHKILLLKRNNQPMCGMYTGVGGKIEFDEGLETSCIREVKEETGLDVWSVRLCGVIKTILDGNDSSWLLFVYTSDDFSGELSECDEGELEWVDIQSVFSKNLIGFIKEILPRILKAKGLVEAVIRHDSNGNVISCV